MLNQKKLVIGLGNPGPRYRNTRHNIGFLVLQKKVFPSHKIKEKKNVHGDLVAKKAIRGCECYFLMPQTYMNLSGGAVLNFLKYHSISTENILVISDDLDLPWGTLRLRAKGSSGGHLGLSSIIESLGAKDFARLRLGIGRPKLEGTTSFVLKAFEGGDQEILDFVLERAAQVVETWIVEGDKKARDFISKAGVYNKLKT